MICSGDMVDEKIQQSDWLQTFWPIFQQQRFSQIWGLCRNNIFLDHFCNFGGKKNVPENLAVSHIWVSSTMSKFGKKTNDTILRKHLDT